jgi:hypothetical protein
MNIPKNTFTQQLFENDCLSAEQLESIENYRNREIFSLRFELRTFLYVSILMFTSGVGILIFQNIDTIGHSIILALIFMATVACFSLSYKNAPSFAKHETKFANPLYEYLILAANMLFCSFVGYLQFQYQVFGTKYGLATLIPTLVALGSGYYFDNKSVLSMGITGLAAFWGLSVTPQSLLESGLNSFSTLSYTAIILGTALIGWNYYSSIIKLKTHFALVFLTFGLHLIAIASIAGLFEDLWFLFAIVLSVLGFYFYKQSYLVSSVTLLVFTILYCYVGFNIVAFKLLDFMNAFDFFVTLAYLSPIYFVGSIVLFIKLVKNFSTKISHDRIS